MHVFHLHQNQIYTDLPSPSSEQFLRAIWDAVSFGVALILSQIRLNLLLSHCAFFLSQQGKVSIIYNFSQAGFLQSSTCFGRGLSQEADVTIKDFSAFLDVRRHKTHRAHKISWQYPSEGLCCQSFPEHREPHSQSPPRTPFREAERPWLQSSWVNPCRVQCNFQFFVVVKKEQTKNIFFLPF